MVEQFEAFCKKEFLKQKEGLDPVFFESLEYSFFSGGKRFRPRLIMSLSVDLGVDVTKVFPAAMAVELIHTYSLIHDDLPSMDDDRYRRGKLSHHAKYGEASAVLAGDGLLTFAFEVLASHYKDSVLKDLVLKLARCSGALGMVGGQVYDCLTKKRSEAIFEKIHILKTAKLFEFCCYSVSCVKQMDSKSKIEFGDFGKSLGLLFQLQDDLFDEDKKDEREEENILSILSREQVIAKIDSQKAIALEFMESLNIPSDGAFMGVVHKLFEREH